MKKQLKSISNFQVNRVTLDNSNQLKGGEVHFTIEYFGDYGCNDRYYPLVEYSRCGGSAEECIIDC